MENIINGISTDAKIITPNDGYHYFFAYYDMRATGEHGKHLCHRVKFFDRLPTSEDVAELGYLEDGNFVKFAETTAWNFQQGAMLQYHPYLENTVYYNVCENGRFMTVTHDIVSGEKKYADKQAKQKPCKVFNFTGQEGVFVWILGWLEAHKPSFERGWHAKHDG